MSFLLQRIVAHVSGGSNGYKPTNTIVNIPGSPPCVLGVLYKQQLSPPAQAKESEPQCCVVVVNGQAEKWLHFEFCFFNSAHFEMDKIFLGLFMKYRSFVNVNIRLGFRVFCKNPSLFPK